MTSKFFNVSKLANGLTVLTYNMPYLKSVAVNLLVKVGSRYENPKQSGISHFLEHMAFKGTHKRSARDIAEEFDVIGGNFNAYTSKENTVYHAKVLGEHVFTALEILSDILQNSKFNAEDIAKELDVITQEIAQTYDNPDELVYENLYKTAFKNQPLGESILGTKQTIANFDKESFQNFQNLHYGADNIFLSVAGNVEHADIEKYAEMLFSSIKISEKQTFVAASYNGGYCYHKKDLEQTNLALGFKSVSYINLQQFYHTQILSLILGGGISSRLFQHIREDLGLAYSVGSYNSSYFDSGLFSIYAATAPDKLNHLFEGLIGEMKKITENISKKELIRAKAQIKASIYMAEEKSAYKAEEIGKNFAFFGNYTTAEEVLQMIIDSEIDDITFIAKQIFSTNPTISIVGSKTDLINYDDLTTKFKIEV